MTPATAAIVGYTGFVGSNLVARPSRTLRYEAHFNSRNIDTISGKSYDAVVCSAVPAVKWIANKDPDTDWAQIFILLAHLKSVRTGHFVLISTIDVYPDAAGRHDEGYHFSSYADHAYGRHRRMVEEWVMDAYPANHTIIRLPALFGDGLKKNALYDLMTSHMLSSISPDGCYQWYSLDRLVVDLDTAIEAGIPQINLVTPPISMRTIQARFFPEAGIGGAGSRPAFYDVRTAHAGLFGDPEAEYIANEEETLRQMEDFIFERCGRAI